MPIIRTKEQSSDETLEEFYNFLVDQNEIWKITRDSMVLLISKINEEFPNRLFHALISHNRLVVLENEKINSDWLVIFSSSMPNEYYIEAMLPDKKSIWKNSRVVAEVKGVDKVIEYFKLSLEL